MTKCTTPKTRPWQASRLKIPATSNRLSCCGISGPKFIPTRRPWETTRSFRRSGTRQRFARKPYGFRYGPRPSFSFLIMPQNNYPKLHNAMWPGLVGKGSPGAEPFIDLDAMLELTARAEVDGIKFDGVDIFLFEPHVNIDSTDDELKELADKVAAKGFVVGSVVGPI